MRLITDTSELRKIQMDILSYVDNICRNHGIHYSLSGGSLIGAVRHKGYIPWDDDIDIMLTRKEYDRLVAIIDRDSHIAKTPYKVLTHDIISDFKYPYAKVVDNRTIMHEHIKGCKDFGIGIDVFPCDPVPDEDVILTRLLKRMRLLYNILMIKRLKWSKQRSFSKNLIAFFSQIAMAPLSTNRLLVTMDHTARKAADDNSSRKGCLVWGYGRKEIMPSSLYNNFIDMPFEDRTYMAVADYDTYLSNLFGDYMKLPPIEKRATHHAYEAYMK